MLLTKNMLLPGKVTSDNILCSLILIYIYILKTSPSSIFPLELIKKIKKKKNSLSTNQENIQTLPPQKKELGIGEGDNQNLEKTDLKK